MRARRKKHQTIGFERGWNTKGAKADLGRRRWESQENFSKTGKIARNLRRGEKKKIKGSWKSPQLFWFMRSEGKTSGKLCGGESLKLSHLKRGRPLKKKNKPSDFQRKLERRPERTLL